jgi:hypothetical protein
MVSYQQRELSHWRSLTAKSLISKCANLEYTLYTAAFFFGRGAHFNKSLEKNSKPFLKFKNIYLLQSVLPVPNQLACNQSTGIFTVKGF